MTTNHQPPTLKFFKFSLLLSLLLILPFSCAKEKIAEPDWKNQLENVSEEELRSFDDQTALLLGESIIDFFDEIMKDGLQKYIERTNYLATIPQPESLKEVAEIYNVEEKVITDYLEALQKHKDYLSDIDNRLNITKGIYLYVEHQANQKTRWVFRAAASIFNARQCGFWQVAARVADTAVLGVATVYGGGPITAAGAVGSYVETVVYVSRC